MPKDGNVPHARGLPLPKYPSDKEAANTLRPKPDPSQGLDHSHRNAIFQVTFTSPSGVPLAGPAAPASERVAKDKVTSIVDFARVHMGVSFALLHSVHFANSYPLQSIPPEGVYFDVTVQPSTTVCDPKCSGRASRISDQGEIKNHNGEVIFSRLPQLISSGTNIHPSPTPRPEGPVES
ncbi:hypothetical protein D9757_001036 [Collybiopsis confluens]|uniref:Uncharacterized protein n=1 Tax=Collybiopsis confluens TaxID=2823264 RepID=A0A8H5I086_9AGAR|nr:hypothetical protein D9757_001036 [Collybiopsis confluens]